MDLVTMGLECRLGKKVGDHSVLGKPHGELELPWKSLDSCHIATVTWPPSVHELVFPGGSFGCLDVEGLQMCAGPNL